MTGSAQSTRIHVMVLAGCLLSMTTFIITNASTMI